MTKQAYTDQNSSSDFLCHSCDSFKPNDIFELRFHGHCTWVDNDLEKLVKKEEGCSGYVPKMEGFQ